LPAPTSSELSLSGALAGGSSEFSGDIVGGLHSGVGPAFRGRSSRSDESESFLARAFALHAAAPPFALGKSSKSLSESFLAPAISFHAAALTLAWVAARIHPESIAGALLLAAAAFPLGKSSMSLSESCLAAAFAGAHPAFARGSESMSESESCRAAFFHHAPHFARGRLSISESLSFRARPFHAAGAVGAALFFGKSSKSESLSCRVFASLTGFARALLLLLELLLLAPANSVIFLLPQSKTWL